MSKQKKDRRLGSLKYVQIIVCGNVIVLTTSVNDHGNKQEMLNSHFIRANLNSFREDGLSHFRNDFKLFHTNINYVIACFIRMNIKQTQ